MRLWPDTLAGRTLLLLGTSVLVLVIAASGLLRDERREAFRSQQHRHLVERITTLYQLTADASPQRRAELTGRFRDDDVRIAIESEPRIPRGRPAHPLERLLQHALRRQLPDTSRGDIRVKAIENRDQGEHRPGRPGDIELLHLNLRLPDGRWLNVEIDNYQQTPPWARPTLALLLGLLLLIGIAGYWSSRRLSRPMRELALAAERFGLGQEIAPLTEQGPREVRETIRAFNRMQERLQRNLRERSLMLAAVSHDLRTPITALRLRAEYIEDEEMRERTLATLAQMENILTDTLAFARDEGRDRQARRFDLAALVQTLCDEYADLGHELHCTLPDRLPCTGRPSALQRALTNLLDNALRYGNKVSLRLVEDAEGTLIEIEDDGPGIPEDKLEEVFMPFYRVEASRSEETGGIGLGLAIARMLVHAQGGTLTLSNREPHGLCAQLRLPVGA